MKGIKVEVDLAELIIGSRYRGDDETSEPIDLLTIVVEDVARQLLETVKTNRDIYPRLHDRVREIRDEEIREAIRPAIAQALTASIQPTNAYGQSRGEPVTLHEVIIDHATKWLQTPKSNGYEKPQTTPVQDFIRAEVEGALYKELRLVIEQAKKDVLDAVHAQGAKVLTETIARLGGIR